MTRPTLLYNDRYGDRQDHLDYPVVADTNILISALLFGGRPGVSLDLAKLRKFGLISSTVLLDELQEKLLGKFKIPASDVRAIRFRLEAFSSIVHPDYVLDVIADDPDNHRVLDLECAVARRRLDRQRRPASPQIGCL